MILDVLRIIGVKKQPSRTDRFCDERDKPLHPNDYADRGEPKIDLNKTQLKQKAKQQMIMHQSDTQHHDHDDDIHDQLIDEVMEQSTTNRVSDGISPLLSESVPPGACLRKHTSQGELEERVGSRKDRSRRYLGRDAKNATDRLNQPAIDIGDDSDDAYSGRQLSSNDEGGNEDDFTHYHYDLYDRFFSCIADIADILNKRLNIHVPPVTETVDIA
jgi:hypothetical protein